MNAMEHLRELFGSQRAMAGAIGVSVSTVSMWNVNGIPAERRLQFLRLCRERGMPVRPEVLMGKDVADAMNAGALASQAAA